MDERGAAVGRECVPRDVRARVVEADEDLGAPHGHGRFAVGVARFVFRRVVHADVLPGRRRREGADGPPRRRGRRGVFPVPARSRVQREREPPPPGGEPVEERGAKKPGARSAGARRSGDRLEGVPGLPLRNLGRGEVEKGEREEQDGGSRRRGGAHAA